MIKILSWLRVFKNTILVILTLFLYIIIFQNLKTKLNMYYIPNILNHTYLNVLSSSMSPTLNPNDLVIGKKVKSNTQLNVGDIITYKDEGYLVTHRIMQIKNDGKTFVTKGDSNETKDSREVNIDQIISRYVIAIPKCGYIIVKLQDEFFLFIIWIIVMYIILSELYKEVKKHKKNLSQKH